MSTISASTTTTTAYKVTADTTGALVLQTGATPTTAMTIDTSQNVGIGTSTPDVFGRGYTGKILGVSGTQSAIEINSASGQTAYLDLGTNGTRAFSITSAGSSGDLSTIGAIPMTFNTNGAERARIDSSGNLLVGTTANNIVGWSPKLVVQGGDNLVIQSVGNGNVAITTKPSGAFTYTAAYFFNSSGSNVGAINVSTTGTTYATSSDYRLKEDIQPMQGALATVAQLKPCTYKWKSDGSDSQGFIAHELQEVVPECVTGEKDAVENYTDEEGNEQTRHVYQGIDTSFLVATLTAAIQEQQALITQLQADVAALKGQA